jgi:hypothetical protein
MTDDVLGYLRQARALLLEERDEGKNSRELSVALTEIDTAILWRQKDLKQKKPTINEANENE